jgi:LysM repeat protein
MPALVAALNPPAPRHGDLDVLVAALPAPSTEKAWVRVRDNVTIDDLSAKLRVSGERLAALNDVETTHQFRQGEWLIVPAKQVRLVKLLASLDPSELRRTPPLQDLPPLEEGPAVRLGDSIKKIAQRYGVTLQQLLQLNPGLDKTSW